MLSKTIGLKALGELYDSLLDLGIMMDIETLKYEGQWPSSIHKSAILMSFLRYMTSLMILLKCLHNSLFGPVVDKLLYLAIELTNSSSENSFQVVVFY